MKNKYKIVYWRYGARNEWEFDAETKEEALREFHRWCDSDEQFVELLVGPDGEILYDNKKNVIGYRHEKEG